MTRSAGERGETRGPDKPKPNQFSRQVQGSLRTLSINEGFTFPACLVFQQAGVGRVKKIGKISFSAQIMGDYNYNYEPQKHMFNK